MQIILFSLTILVLVSILIRVLHILQVRSARQAAEQGDPLPPLEANSENPDVIGIVAENLSNYPSTLYWQDEVKALRDDGKFQEAIRLCRRQYPKMLAFRQTLITLRASLKQEDKNNEDMLDNLYRTAILASIVKTHKSGHPAEEIQVWNDKLENPKKYWQQLGYKNLELLTRNDCRLLAQHWGEPEYHSDIENVLSIH